MLIEEIITEKEKLKEFLPAVLGGLVRVGTGLGRTALRGAKKLGRGAKRVATAPIRKPGTTIGLGMAGDQLASLFAKDPEAKKIHDEMEATEDEQERERLRLELESRIKHWEDQMNLLYGYGWGESVNERELTKIIEKTPPGREDQVKALKKKWPNDLERVYATAWASYNKRKK